MSKPYEEINQFGLAPYHKAELCYPYRPVPAFTFWSEPGDGETLAQWQDGRCALCGFRERLVMDHDHETGLIRGLLCRSCNTTEGVSDHHLDLWRSGITSAAKLGLREKYTSPFGAAAPNLRTSDEAFEADLDLIAEAATRADA